MKVVLIKFPELESGMQESIQVNSEYLLTSRFLREGENQFEIFLKNFPIPTPIASKCGPCCISPSWDHLIPMTLDAHYFHQPGWNRSSKIRRGQNPMPQMSVPFSLSFLITSCPYHPQGSLIAAYPHGYFCL